MKKMGSGVDEIDDSTGVDHLCSGWGVVSTRVRKDPMKSAKRRREVLLGLGGHSGAYPADQQASPGIRRETTGRIRAPSAGPGRPVGPASAGDGLPAVTPYPVTTGVCAVSLGKRTAEPTRRTPSTEPAVHRAGEYPRGWWCAGLSCFVFCMIPPRDRHGIPTGPEGLLERSLGPRCLVRILIAVNRLPELQMLCKCNWSFLFVHLRDSSSWFASPSVSCALMMPGGCDTG